MSSSRSRSRGRTLDLITPSSSRTVRSTSGGYLNRRRAINLAMDIARGGYRLFNNKGERSNSDRRKKSKITGPITTTRNETSTSVRAAKVKNRMKKTVTIKKRPAVKVTKKFQEKVTKALEPKAATGKYTEIGYQAIAFPASLGNQQTVERIGNDVGVSGSKVYSFFNPAWVLDAASVLFNGKTATRDTKFQKIGATLETDFGVGSFDARKLKIHVKNSYSAFVFRNNTPRTWIIQLYEVSPKTNTNIYDEGDAVGKWFDGMLNENQVTNPRVNMRTAPGVGVNDAATPNTLYVTPNVSKLFTQRYTVERHDITLDPGQSYDHFMQGPSNVVYDYQKFWKTDSGGTADQFLDNQKKFTRQLFLVARLDLVQDSGIGFGRYGNSVSPLGDRRLIVEWKNYINLYCPDQAQGISSVGGAQEQRTEARDCYLVKNWYVPTTVEAATRYELNTGNDNV